MLGEAHLARGEKGAPRFCLDEVARRATQWLVLSGCRKGPLTRALMLEGPRAAARALERLIAAFGRENVAVELWDHGAPDDVARNDAWPSWPFARRRRRGDEQRALRHARRLRARQRALGDAGPQSLEEMEGWLNSSPLAHLRSDAEQRRRFARWPGVVERPASSRAALAFDLRLVAPNLPPFIDAGGHGRAVLPRGSLVEGATRALRPRDHERVPGAWRQIDHELEVIATLGFAGYFLTVWDITEFCRRNDIYCQGRGSAANSAVCFSLGITNADAVALNLFFERFLSPARDGPPDIDVDIESGRREEVIQYVYERYGPAPRGPGGGRHHVPTALGGARRGAGLRLQRGGGGRAARRRRPPQRMTADGPTRPLVTTMASWRPLLNRPRHLGIHSAGMVLCDRPVIEVCPVEWGRMPGRTVLQWDKDDCAAIGLVKFDLLGLGMLDALHRCRRPGARPSTA
jgi:error-prone DNA polymerase